MNLLRILGLDREFNLRCEAQNEAKKNEANLKRRLDWEERIRMGGFYFVSTKSIGEFNDIRNDLYKFGYSPIGKMKKTECARHWEGFESGNSGIDYYSLYEQDFEKKELKEQKK
jgi:hypothetical protein